MDKVCCLLLAARRFPLLHTSPFITSSFRKFLTTLGKDELININCNGDTSQNLFAEFAATKLNLSSADIARIFKIHPALQRLKTLDKVEQGVDMLKRHGCSHHHIALIIKLQPQVIVTSVERIMEPKLRLLNDFGIRGDGLAAMLTRRPQILKSSLKNVLLPNLQFLKSIFLAENWLVKALLRNPYIVDQSLEKILKPSVALWEGFDFRGEELMQFLLTRPALLRCTCWTPHKADLIHRIGIDKGSKTYKYVLMTVATSRVDTLEAKINNFQQCGLTAQETMELFRVSPDVFCLSKEKIRQNMDYVVNNMEFPANTVVKHPLFLRNNLDKFLKPRFLVWQKLKSMGGNTSVKTFNSILWMGEKYFVSKIVTGHPESALLYSLYQGALAEASCPTNISKKA